MLEPLADDPEIRDRVIANFISALRGLCGSSPKGAVEQTDGALFIASGVPFAFLNPTFLVSPDVDLAAVLDRARQFYLAHDVPWVVFPVDDDVARSVESEAESHHLVSAGVLPGMALRAIDAAPFPVIDRLQIAQVADEAGTTLFNDVMAAGFEMPRETLAAWDTPAFAAIPGITLYLGYVGNVPVAASALYQHAGIAGIYNVATIPAFRRQGIGAAMTGRAVEDGFKAGCDIAYLQSSEIGYSVYESMGFRTVINHQMWAPASEAQSDDRTTLDKEQPTA